MRFMPEDLVCLWGDLNLSGGEAGDSGVGGDVFDDHCACTDDGV